MLGLDPAQQLRAIHAGHLQVEDDKVRRVDVDGLHGRETVCCRRHAVPAALQGLPAGIPDRLLVVHDHDHGRRVHYASSAAGIMTLNVVPAPT